MKAERELKVTVEISTVKQATAIVGSLSYPSKMPGAGWGISATKCKRGSTLAKIEGSVCSKCYALKGNYQYQSVTTAHERRLNGYYHPLWEQAMIFLIGRLEEPYFRWFDSGDLQSVDMLEKIYRICRALPHIQFWMPTRELGILRSCRSVRPNNLTIRASAAMIGGPPPAGFRQTSTVALKGHRKTWSALVQHNGKSQWFCPAPLQNGRCGTCRACWDSAVENTTYLQH